MPCRSNNTAGFFIAPFYSIVSVFLQIAIEETLSGGRSVISLTGKSNRRIELSAECTTAEYQIAAKRRSINPLLRFINWNRSRDLKLTVMLPAEIFSVNVFTSLHAQSVSGNVDLRFLKMTELSSSGTCSLGSASGDLHLPDMKCGRLVASSVSGNITAGSAAAETAEVKSTSGYIQFSGMTERISIKTVFGNISTVIWLFRS